MIPDPALVYVIGASGSGKSTWCSANFRAVEVVSSDALRAVVGSSETDLDATDDAFGVLDAIVEARIRRGLTVVVDTLGMEPERRRRIRALAAAASLPAVAVVLDPPPAAVRSRNRAASRPLPSAALDRQLARLRELSGELAVEGWDAVHVVGAEPAEVVVEAAHSRGAQRARTDQAVDPEHVGFVLQLSAFPWGEDPARWLAEVVEAAADSGFEGVALMDHLIQIPQVGRAWDPLPEPFVTLGMLAGLAHARDQPLRLGTLVTPVTFREPGLVAKAVATLDVLSGGRAFCGIGAGWWAREHDAYGLELPPVGERMAHLARSIETIRALWAPGTRPYAGVRVSLPETTLYPRPVSDIAIIVGGGGERQTLRIAARLGDACNVRSDLATLDRKIAVLRRHCLEVGRDPGEVAVTVLDVPVVGRTRDEVAVSVDRLRGRASARTYAGQHHAGTVDQQIGRYRLLAERGVSTVFVSFPDLTGPDEIHRFAPIPAAFAASGRV